MFELRTLNDVMKMVTGRGEKAAILWQDAGGAWQPMSSDQLYARVRKMAQVFEGWGVQRGNRVVLLSENRWEWAVTDFATLALGAVDVPLYATSTAEQVGEMVRDCGAKVLVCSTAKQYAKLSGMGECPELEHVVVMDDGEFEGVESFSRLMAGADAMKGRDKAFDEVAASVGPEDLATIIYTSGTTGEPKGARLLHGNLAANLNVSTEEFGFNDRDSLISFLPLSHVTARHVDYAMMCHGARLTYCPEFNKIVDALKETRPTIFIGVPRVYEKIRQGVEGKSQGLKARVLSWALGVGKAHRQVVLDGGKPGGVSYRLADKLVFSKIREAFGGCVHTFVAGGAPLGMETACWFADVGVRIYEGYGLTETSPVIGLATPRSFKLASVGRVLKNLEVRLAGDGELEVKGPSVFPGYWNKDKETAEAFTEDGWFKTGDIAKLEDGFLTITDRKKELLKTSGGKLIAPQPVEAKLKANLLVGQAAMVGDKHKFACVLISPNFQALEQWASKNGVSAGEHGALVREAKVVAEYQRIVDGVNKQLPPYETMKRMKVVGEEWSLESGEMTPSMKLKRRVLADRYKSEIEEFYKDEATSRE